MKKILSVVLLGMLITLSAACSGGGGSSDSEPSTPKTYSITGKITANSEELADVTVILSGASTASTTTDASGNYSFAELTDGDYTVTPIITGYTFSPSNTAVSVNGANQTNINFTATSSTTPTYTISGKVSGAVLSGVTIYLTGASNASTTTDSSGNYNFVELVNGDYTVTPSRTGYTFSPLSTAVNVNGTDRANINFTATSSTIPTYTISGTVSGAVASGVTITLTGTGSSTTTTDSSGNFSFSNAANGSYTITPSKTGYTFSPASRSITVSSANLTGQNFTATASTIPTYTISGTVSGEVASGVTITLTGTGSHTTTTDSSGNYTFSGAGNGSYTITPSKTGYTFSPTSRTITVSSANITGQNFTATAIIIPTTYTISGTVSGAVASGVTITLTGTGSSTTTTDSSGNYTFNGAANGSYTLAPYKTGYTFSPTSRSITVNNANLTGENFTATADTTTYSSAGGVPVSGYPNWQERAMLVVTNAVRQAPQAYRTTYTSFTNILLPANYPAVAPVYWNENLNHSSRAHAIDMATTPCIQHDSCDGTPVFTRINSYYPSSTFVAENIAAGVATPKEAVDLLICDRDTTGTCVADGTTAPDGTTDGHRHTIMNIKAKELGNGYYYYSASPYDYYWVQDFGATAAAIFQPPIVSGAHMTINFQLTFWLNYYDTAAPQTVRLVKNGSATTLTLAIGSAQSGLYTATAVPSSGCESYHFEAIDSDGQGWRYPGTGEFRTYGIGSCAEDYTSSTP